MNNFSETLTVKLGLRLSQLIDVVICNNTKTKIQKDKDKDFFKSVMLSPRHKDKQTLTKTQVRLGSNYGFRAAQFKYNYFR